MTLEKSFTFPCGERHVQLVSHLPSLVDVTWDFTGSDSIVELMLLGDALRRSGRTINELHIAYVPFARQDRVANPGEPLSIAVMAKIINDMGARKVVITDPHSDVTPALINHCVVIPQHEVFKGYFPMTGETILVSPDAGALKKIYPLAKITGLNVVECGKIRNTVTGEITGTHATGSPEGKHCVIVDDICDGGRTFTELATLLQARRATKITLMVTHGFFTKGLQVFDGLIDEIYTRKGRVK